MAQPVMRGQASKPQTGSTKVSALDKLAILMAWSFSFLMLLAVGTAVKSGF